MPLPTVGIVTIGQSPRTDVVPEIAALLPPGTPLIERGALDGAERAELARLAPSPGEDLLITRLRDGTEVTLAEARVMPLVGGAVEHVTSCGAMIVAVLCTGSLARIPCPGPLLLPGPLVRNLVAAVVPGGRLGVVVPAADQVDGARADWSAAAGDILVLAASPYASPVALRAAAATLAAWHPDIVVLDCLGFDGSMRRLVARAVRVPVILPRTVLAGAISALL
jgi:protein AroM